MAKNKIPSALEMRRLKYGEATDAERKQVADKLRAQDRRAELLLLLERHPDASVSTEEAQWAVENGQAFHLLSVHRMTGAVTEEQFRACAQKALASGRAMDARNCYQELGDEAAIAEFADQLPESMRPEPQATEEAPKEA